MDQPNFESQQYFALNLDGRGYSTMENAIMNRGLYHSETVKFGDFEVYPIIYSKPFDKENEIGINQVIQYNNRFYRIKKIIGRFSEDNYRIIDRETDIMFDLQDYLI